MQLIVMATLLRKRAANLLVQWEGGFLKKNTDIKIFLSSLN
jgi:hypothetical protein